MATSCAELCVTLSAAGRTKETVFALSRGGAGSLPRVPPGTLARAFGGARDPDVTYARRSAVRLRRKRPCRLSGVEVEISDDRYRRLLRPRRKRPCSRRAAEQRDELAPFHCPMSPV